MPLGRKLSGRWLRDEPNDSAGGSHGVETKPGKCGGLLVLVRSVWPVGFCARHLNSVANIQQPFSFFCRNVAFAKGTLEAICNVEGHEF